MPERLNPIQHRDFINGRIAPSEVSNFKMPEGAVTESINGHFDERGNWKSRLGLTQLGDSLTAGKSIVGLFNHRHSINSSYHQLIAVNGSILYYLNGSTWTQIRTGLTDSAKSRFTDFLDYVFHVNGNDITQTWDGYTSGSFGTTNASNAPIGQFIENYKSKVYITGNSVHPDRLYFSSLPNSSNQITWTVGTDYIDISPQDGEDNKGLKKFAKELLVFKQNNMYRFWGSSGTDPEPIVRVGTSSQESIVEGKDGIYFYHPNSNSIQFYNGSYPLEISIPVKDYLKAVPLSYHGNVAGWPDDDHIFENIGDITINDVTFSNVVLVYTISSKVWTIYSYAPELVIGANYVSGTSRVQVVGDTNGKIYTFNSGYTDNDSPINCSLITKYYEYGLLSARKVITKLSAICQKAKDIKLFWQSDDEIDWHPVGVINQYVEVFKNKTIKGNRIRWRITASMTTAPFTFEGLEILEIISEGIVQ